MIESKLLLNAYYETLYELLEAKKDVLATRIEQSLAEEVANRGFGNLDESKFAAYRDTCLAFIDERIETYNPIGVQYTFDRIRASQAYELELQLDWYDSRAEFEALLQAIRERAETQMTEDNITEIVDELINQVGAFPDRSIISAYEAEPALPKLPDYIVARAIEEVIR